MRKPSWQRVLVILVIPVVGFGLTAPSFCGLNPEGKVLASFGSYGEAPGQFVWPHTIAIGPDGALYVGEVATGMRMQKFTK